VNTNAVLPIHIAVSRTIESAIQGIWQDISHDLTLSTEVDIRIETPTITTASWEAAHLVANRGRREGLTSGSPKRFGIQRPDDKGMRVLASLGLSDSYVPTTVQAEGALFRELKFRGDVSNAPALIGVSTIDTSASGRSPGSLAIGIWTQYVHPRLALPLLHPARREPKTADVALGLSRRVVGTLLVAGIKGYVVLAWAVDLIAAELAGLAVWTAGLPHDEERIGPWEDPVVQRATELDLGVQSPSALELRIRWAGESTDQGGLSTLIALASTVSSLLNIPPDQVHRI
jgi:hypothetical protein